MSLLSLRSLPCPRDSPHWFPSSLLALPELPPHTGYPPPPRPPFSSLHLILMSILFPPLSEIQASSLGTFLLLSFFGSVAFSMDILYLMATIYLEVSTYHGYLVKCLFLWFWGCRLGGLCRPLLWEVEVLIACGSSASAYRRTSVGGSVKLSVNSLTQSQCLETKEQILWPQ